MKMPEGPNRFQIDADPGFDLDLFQAEFCRSINLPASIPEHVAIKQIIGGLLPLTPEHREGINFLLAMVATEQPTSLLEAQLLVQLVSAHELYTKMLKKADNETWSDHAEKFVNIAMKLSRGFKNGLESYRKIKRGNIDRGDEM
jgi:hypothetical protein